MSVAATQSERERPPCWSFAPPHRARRGEGAATFSPSWARAAARHPGASVLPSRLARSSW